MISEKRLAELRDHFKLSNSFGKTKRFGYQGLDLTEIFDTIEALLKVARAANNIEDMLEVPTGLGASASETCQKAINTFRKALEECEL